MPWSWSNPEPSNATAAALQAPFHVEAQSIGPLVNSLLSFRKAQDELKRQQMNDMLNGISKGFSGAENAYHQSQADDAANAAIYSSQSPQAYQDYLTNGDNSVPDYGGSGAYTALEHARKLNPDAFQSANDKALDAAKLDAAQALAYSRWNGGGDGGNAYQQPPFDTAPAGMVWNGHQYVKSNVDHWDGLVATARGRLDSKGNFDNNYSEAGNGPVVQVVSPTGKTFTMPWDAYQARVAAKQGGGVGSSGSGRGSQGVRQSDVDQASQAMSQDTPDYNHSIPTGGDSGQAQAVLIQQAHDAISRGAPAGAVIERLKQYGIDPSSAGF